MQTKHIFYNVKIPYTLTCLKLKRYFTVCKYRRKVRFSSRKVTLKFLPLHLPYLGENCLEHSLCQNTPKMYLHVVFFNIGKRRFKMLISNSSVLFWDCFLFCSPEDISRFVTWRTEMQHIAIRGMLLLSNSSAQLLWSDVIFILCTKYKALRWPTSQIRIWVRVSRIQSPNLSRSLSVRFLFNHKNLTTF